MTRPAPKARKSKRIRACGGGGVGGPALAALLLCAAASTGGALAATAVGPVAPTESGRVRGLSADGVDRFLGLPYAAPPVGARRWRPPAPPAAWRGVRQAVRFGGKCPQSPRGVFASPSTAEDCLYLNVFTPASGVGGADKAGTGRRPVMVWFYGGGLFSGESDDYDGARLARRGGVVVVTLNYRVGALGFLSHPALNGEGHASVNYGLMDQQAALKWVRRNIAAFGGDPRQVTIFGQSGGATSVMAQLASPAAAGLFQRAIVESGTHIHPYSAALALKDGQDFARAAGCASQDAACLRALPVEAVLKAQAPMIKDIAANFPSVDGTIVPREAYDAFSRGLFNKVPILAGLTEDEQAFFLPESSGAAPLTAQDYARYLAAFGPDHAQALAGRYPLANYSSPSLAEIDAAQGDKVCVSRRLYRAWSAYVPVYAYQFEDRAAPTYFPPLSYPMRAYHTAELQYLFPGFHGGGGQPHPLDPAQARLSDIMVDDWTSFARTGVPSAVTAGQSWPRYAAARDAVQILDTRAVRSVGGYGARYACGLWDTILTGGD